MTSTLPPSPATGPPAEPDPDTGDEDGHPMPGPAFALTEALRLARAGYALTPVTIRRLPNGEKRAHFWLKWQKKADTAISSDPDVIRDWAVQYGPDCSFALCCRESGVEGVDLDVKPLAGIDGPLWWSSQSLPMGSLLVRTPSGGLHNIWRRRPGGPTLPNGAGQLVVDGRKIRGVDTRSAGGVFFAAGGHVIGDTEHYEIQGPLPHVADLDFTPDAVLQLWGANRAESNGSANGAGPPPTGPLAARNPFTIQDAYDFVTPSWVALVNSVPGGQNNAVNALAMAVGHFITTPDHPGHWTRDDAETWVLQAARECGYAQREPGPLQATMRSGLDAGMRQPFPCIVGPSAPSATDEDAGEVTRAELDEFFADEDYDGNGAAPGSVSTPAPGPGTGYDAATHFENQVQAELNKARARRVALQRLAAEDLAELDVLDLDEFSAAEPVQYLIDGLLWKTGTARIFGPPGQTKSFLALDLALSLASGAPWKVGGQIHGRAPVVVHYIMAEGKAVNVMRTNAWFARHGEHLREQARGRFRAIPQGVMLTPEGIGRYLKLVEADKPALIILDTKHRMMAGDENSASDMAVLVRAVDTLKETSGGNVCLVDHSGLFDGTRARGSSAVQAAMDTEIRVTYDYDTRVALAEVTRDKAAEVCQQWQYRLSTVQLSSTDDVVTLSAAVPVPITEGDQQQSPFDQSDPWWSAVVPQAVVDALPAGKHCGADGCPKSGHQSKTVAVVHDIWRVLDAHAGDLGMTRSEITKELTEAKRWDRRIGSAAFGALYAHGILTPGDTRSRWTVT